MRLERLDVARRASAAMAHEARTPRARASTRSRCALAFPRLARRTGVVRRAAYRAADRSWRPSATVEGRGARRGRTAPRASSSARRGRLLPVDRRDARSGWRPAGPAATRRVVSELARYREAGGRGHPDRPGASGRIGRGGARASPTSEPGSPGDLPVRWVDDVVFAGRSRGRPIARPRAWAAHARRARSARERGEAAELASANARADAAIATVPRGRDPPWHHPHVVRTLYRAARVHTLGHPPAGEWVLVDDRHVAAGRRRRPARRRPRRRAPGRDDPARVHRRPRAPDEPRARRCERGRRGHRLGRRQLLAVAAARAGGRRNGVVSLQGYDESRWSRSDPADRSTELDAVTRDAARHPSHRRSRRTA